MQMVIQVRNIETEENIILDLFLKARNAVKKENGDNITYIFDNIERVNYDDVKYTVRYMVRDTTLEKEVTFHLNPKIGEYYWVRPFKSQTLDVGYFSKSGWKLAKEQQAMRKMIPHRVEIIDVIEKCEY